MLASAMSDCSEDKIPVSRIKLLDLSDELLLLIIQQLDRHDTLPRLRMTCKKLRYMSEVYMFRNIALSLEENPQGRWWNLDVVPPQIIHTRCLTFLNRCQPYHGAPFYGDSVSSLDTSRIDRWSLFTEYSDEASLTIKDCGLFKGSRYFWHVRIPDHQMQSFRYRLAYALDLPVLEEIISKHANALTELELSMLLAPEDDQILEFEATLSRSSLHHKLQSFTYHGLSFTEPLPINGRHPEGRFRAVRPLFRKNYKSIKQLRLSQAHCLSQIGKTPFYNGHTYQGSLCDLDELYYSPVQTPANVKTPVTLDLEVLELGGFRVSHILRANSKPKPSSKFVKVQLHMLRRLVLEDCDKVDSLLNKLVARKKEIRLQDFGIRVEEDGEGMSHGDRVALALRQFLCCFEGLHTLSVLWKGDSLGDLIECLRCHEKTMQVFVNDLRFVDDSEESSYRYTNIPQQFHTSWFCGEGGAVFQNLKEVGITLRGSDIIDDEYLALKILSQCSKLQTVHIRSFPQLQALTKDEKQMFWSERYGYVNDFARSLVERFAEHIALPFYSLPETCITNKKGDGPLLADVMKVMEIHQKRREEELRRTFSQFNINIRHGGVEQPIKLSNLITSSTPVKYPADLILSKLAQHDERLKVFFERTKHKDVGKKEEGEYLKLTNKIKSILRFTPDTPKPNLKLLVVGDWRYRDQMNLAGPRSWDPQVWVVEKTEEEKKQAAVKADRDYDSENEEINEEELGTNYRLRTDFKKEWDTAILPMFFEIDWIQNKNETSGKYTWKAKAKYLRQSTVEGYGALGNVKCLDFAWQD